VEATQTDPHAQSICLESCQANCALNVQNGEEHRHEEYTCSRAHVEAHSPTKVEVFLQENRRTALHGDDHVLHTVLLGSHLQFRPKR
jgi:hypothetical protein